MQCQFTQSPDYPELKVCQVCGNQMISEFPPSRLRARCGSPIKYTKPIEEVVLEYRNKQNITPSIVEPSLGAKVANLAEDAAAAPSFRFAPDETTKARLAICETCEMKRGNSCGLCGCNLAWKATLAGFQCPAGKWTVYLYPEEPNSGAK